MTYNIPCATWYEGTAQLLSSTEFESHVFFALFYWQNPCWHVSKHAGVFGAL